MRVSARPSIFSFSIGSIRPFNDSTVYGCDDGASRLSPLLCGETGCVCSCDRTHLLGSSSAVS